MTRPHRRWGRMASRQHHKPGMSSAPADLGCLRHRCQRRLPSHPRRQFHPRHRFRPCPRCFRPIRHLDLRRPRFPHRRCPRSLRPCPRCPCQFQQCPRIPPTLRKVRQSSRHLSHRFHRPWSRPLEHWLSRRFPCPSFHRPRRLFRPPRLWSRHQRDPPRRDYPRRNQRRRPGPGLGETHAPKSLSVVGTSALSARRPSLQEGPTTFLP